LIWFPNILFLGPAAIVFACANHLSDLVVGEGARDRVPHRRIARRLPHMPRRQALLLPLLRGNETHVETTWRTGRRRSWPTATTLSMVLPLADREREFLERNGKGDALTDDHRLRDIVRTHPGLPWKAVNAGIIQDVAARTGPTAQHRSGNVHRASQTSAFHERPLTPGQSTVLLSPFVGGMGVA
jgi:hypothetical protein